VQRLHEVGQLDCVELVLHACLNFGDPVLVREEVGEEADEEGVHEGQARVVD